MQALKNVIMIIKLILRKNVPQHIFLERVFKKIANFIRQVKGNSEKMVDKGHSQEPANAFILGGKGT